ncbi:zinc finger, CCHC-type containing protein, partial [Tanacetum coccineum]
YPKETIGYYFYFSPENKIVVARYAEFLEKNLISQEASRREWLDAINAEMQSMKDNQVLRLVNLPPNGKTVRSKWLFNKKTNMDGKMVQPKSFINSKHPKKVCKLQRSIYGLKQSSRRWNKRFDEEIKRFDFAQNLDEPCVYQKANRSNVTFLILMDNIKRGNITLQERLDLNKTQGASTPEEVKYMFLAYSGNPKVELRVTCYCDAGFETDRDVIKSQIRYVFVLNGGAVDWKSSKQSTTEMSAIEVEYIAA